MPWREVTVMSMKLEFVSLVSRGNIAISDLCKRFGISRKTGYKWLNRYKEEGTKGLKERSRKPHSSPKKTTEAVEHIVLNIRDKHPDWGGRKLRRRLQDLGHEDIPRESTITEILRRNNRIDEYESQKNKPCQNFEHEAPNDLWQMDFKGYFDTARGKCHPLCAIDDHSRYSILLQACENQQASTVKKSLTLAFEMYGLPNSMLMDNGSPWGGRKGEYSPIEVWLISLGINVRHGRAYHPQTQGKQERFNRTLKTELVGRRQFLDLDDCQDQFNKWRQIYNHERPHEGIGLIVPAKRYQASSRQYRAIPEPIEYGPQDFVRKVQMDGKIYFKGKEFSVGHAFYGYHVGLRPTQNDGIFDVFFCQQKVSCINLIKNCLGDIDV